MKTFHDVIALWPSISALAADAGVTYGVAKQWRRRNSIPADRWAALVTAGQARGLDVSADLFAGIAHRRITPVASRQSPRDEPGEGCAA
jgi:hypothetical protein